jgi:hypothetical protein
MQTQSIFICRVLKKQRPQSKYTISNVGTSPGRSKYQSKYNFAVILSRRYLQHCFYVATYSNKGIKIKKGMRRTGKISSKTTKLNLLL